MSKEPSKRFGFIAVVGRTNVGKSTLINTLASEKVAITSRKPQTTRNAIRCIINGLGYQAVFVDTPGFHKPHNLLGQNLNKMIVAALSDVDAILFLLDGTHEPGLGERYVAEHVASVKTPVVAAVNKMDKLNNRETANSVAAASALGEFNEVIPISARSGRNVDKLLESLVRLLPEGPAMYPEDMYTDQPERFLVAEFIREKVLELTRKEVPHSVAVTIESMAERPGKDLIDIDAAIYVERETQKGIIIGKGGAMLKEIGTRARRDIERMLGAKVNLKLWVGVEKDWRQKESAIKRLTEE